MFVKKTLVYKDSYGCYNDLKTKEQYFAGYNDCLLIGKLFVHLENGLIPILSVIDYKKENMSKKKILKKYNEYNYQIKEKE